MRTSTPIYLGYFCAYRPSADWPNTKYKCAVLFYATFSNW